MKVVLNKSFGGFSLSDVACKVLNCGPYDYDDYGLRNDESLIATIERLGEKANGWASNLKVVDIPDNTTDYQFHEYDGVESLLYVLDGKINRL